MKKQITFTVDSRKLAGRLYYPPQSKPKSPAILYLHGWTSNQDKNPQYVKALTQLGFICMTIDLPGHGMSEGNLKSLTRADFLNAVLAAYDKLGGLKEVDSNNISAIGSSFGSYLALLLCAQRQLKQLALRVPANYQNEGFNEPHIKFAGQIATIRWRQVPRGPADTYALEALNKFRGKVLIIES